jgi:methylated-DNA-[protein]-cysteine S-methyltransferase
MMGGRHDEARRAAARGTEGGGRAEAVVASPIGPLRLVAEEGAIVAVIMEEPGCEPGAPARDGRDEPLLARAREQLAAWFAGERTQFDLPLRPEGTPFQLAVWRELQAIPFGETRSYGQIAVRVGQPSASRAVGAANGRNPIAVIVPCHRVIGASGALVGYGGGMERKRWLLDHERAVLARRGVEARRDPLREVPSQGKLPFHR